MAEDTIQTPKENIPDSMDDRMVTSRNSALDAMASEAKSAAGGADVGIGGNDMKAEGVSDGPDAGVRNDRTSSPGQDDDSLAYQIETALIRILAKREDLIRNGFKMRLAMKLILESIEKLQQNSVFDKNVFVTDFLFRCDPSNKENRQDVMYVTAIAVLALLGASSTANGDADDLFEEGEAFEGLVHQVRDGFDLIDEFLGSMLEQEVTLGGERLRAQVEAWEVKVKEEYHELPTMRSPFFDDNKVRLEQKQKADRKLLTQQRVPGPKRSRKSSKKPVFKSEAIVQDSSDDEEIPAMTNSTSAAAVTMESLDAASKKAPTPGSKRKRELSEDISGTVERAADDEEVQPKKQRLIRVKHTPSQGSPWRYVW